MNALENGSAVLDADYLGVDEKVINMEDFADTISSVTCSTAQVIIAFNSQAFYDSAKSLWSWVNQLPGRHFFIIVKHSGCGTPVTRRPFNITALNYDTVRRQVLLTGQEVTYESCVHDGHLVVDTLPDQTLTSQVVPRASIGKTINLNRNFTGNIFRTGTSPNIASLDCVDCGMLGTLRVVLDVSIHLFSVKQAYIEFRAQDVSARVNLALTGQVGSYLTSFKELYRNDILGIDIPGIARIGIGPAFGFGWSFSILSNGNITLGGEAKLTPTSIARYCLKGCDTTSQGLV
jgi:hypothetical protein